jgi:Carboxypeptidase regulatory-like domain
VIRVTQPLRAFLLAGSLLVSLVNAQDSRTTPGRLPVKRVVLFKNGVGYFEHVGPVRGNESVTIAFTSGQLNDVLKSLTVLDLNGGRIAGVAYGTAAPVDRQLGDLRLPIGEKATLADFLGGLRGTKIEVKSGTSVVTGRLLSVERKTRISGGTTLEVDYLSLISDSGELRTTEISPSFSVRLLEPGLAGRVDRYLDLVSAGREADVRRMVISTEGSGDRSLYVSYISEVPVWKSTYRIVLNSKPGESPLLQGWAIIDNVVGEDWNNVELSLVAGAPQSFIQNLSQPYYSQRPIVPLPENVSITPQTHESTLIPGGAQLSGTVKDPSGAVVRGATVKAFDANGNLVARTTANDTGSYEIPTLPDGVIRLQVESPGFNTTGVTGIIASAGNAIRQDVQLQVGSMAETVEVRAAAPVTQTNSAEVSSTGMARNAGSGRSLGRGVALGSAARQPGVGYGSGSGGGMGGGVYRVDEARAAAEAAARSQALGDLFEYKLKDPITILKNRSALVPIAQAPITVEKVSLWNDQAGLLRPQRALWITNSTGLTLDGGSVSVLEENTFAGEGVFDPIRPGEKRLFSYAIDLAVNASSRMGTEQERVSRVRINRGTMTQESEVREKKTYTFRNEDSSARTIIVEHPVRRGYVLRGDARPAETTDAWMRFRLQIDPKQTASLVIEEARPTAANFALTNISSEQISLFVSQHSIDPGIETAFREILTQKGAIDSLEAQKSTRDDETQKIFDDQQRLRENIKALKGSPEEKALLQRYTQQLNEQESRLETLQKETAQLDARIEAAKAQLDNMIQQLSFDVKL